MTDIDRTLPGQRTRVTMSSGEEFEVRVCNPDYILWDKTAPRHKWGAAQEVPFLARTFVTWAAAKREGLTSLSFEVFQVEALDLTDVDADETAFPTRKVVEPA